MKIEECYQRLEIPASATDTEIRLAYKRLVKNWHPDKFEADSPLKPYAEERLKIINVAYEHIRKYRALRTKIRPSPPRSPSEPPASTAHDKKKLNSKRLLSGLSQIIKQIYAVFRHSYCLDDHPSNGQSSNINQRQKQRRPFQTVLTELNEGNSISKNKQKRKINYNINTLIWMRQRYGPRRKGGGAITGIASTDSVQAVKWVRNVSSVRRVK